MCLLRQKYFNTINSGLPWLFPKFYLRWPPNWGAWGPKMMYFCEKQPFLSIFRAEHRILAFTHKDLTENSYDNLFPVIVMAFTAIIVE